MFRLTEKETAELVTICDRLKPIKHSSQLPYAFTEHGTLMVASVLSTKISVKISIQIIRVFNELRKILSNHQELKKSIEAIEKKYDSKFKDVDSKVYSLFEAFEEIKSLLDPPPDKLKNKVGFV
jgi:phage regulator Rha-like protein